MGRGRGVREEGSKEGGESKGRAELDLEFEFEFERGGGLEFLERLANGSLEVVWKT